MLFLANPPTPVIPFSEYAKLVFIYQLRFVVLLFFSHPHPPSALSSLLCFAIRYKTVDKRYSRREATFTKQHANEIKMQGHRFEGPDDASRLIVRRKHLFREIRASTVVVGAQGRSDILEREGMNPITSTFIYKRDTINVHPPAVRASIASYPVRSLTTSRRDPFPPGFPSSKSAVRVP